MRKKVLRILNINDSLDLKSGGGTAERTFQLSNLLAKKEGWNCDVLALDSEYLSNERIKYLSPANFFAFKFLFKRFKLPLINFKVLYKLITQADIVHLMGHWSILNAVAYIYTQIYKKPYVVCPAGSLEIYGRSRIIKLIYNIIIGRSIIENATALIAITEDEILHFAKYDVDLSKIIVIPNGVNKVDFPNFKTDFYKKKYLLTEGMLILFMGRLNSIKGPDILLDAFIRIRHLIPKCHLVFAGPDEGLLQSLIIKVNQNGLERTVHFLGHISGHDKIALYRMANLLVVPSRNEAMSIVALEAGICGTPVIVTDQCGFPEIKHVDRLLEVEANPKSIASAIKSLMSDKIYLNQVGIKMKKFVTKKYLWNSAVKKYIRLYDQIILDLNMH